MAITWNPYGNTSLPTFGADDIIYTAPQLNDYGQLSGGSWGLNNPYANTTLNDYWLQQNSIPEWMYNANNVAWEGDANNFGLKIKTDDKEGTVVPYVRAPDGSWVPDMSKITTQYWDSTGAKDKWIAALGGAALVGGPFLATALGGAEGAAGLGAAAAESFPVTSYGAANATALPAFEAASMGASIPWAGPVGVGEALGGSFFPISAEAAAAGAAGAAAPSTWWGPVSAADAMTGLSAIPPATLGSTLSGAASKLGDYIVNNPLQALSQGTALAGLAGSLVEAFKGDNTTSGGGSGGAGSTALGWNDPLPKYNVTQQYVAAPAGYRPGFDPEHVYLRTSFNGSTLPPPALQGGIANALPLPLVDDSLKTTQPAGQTPTGFASGGLAAARMVRGAGDGMSDSIRTSIDGQEDALLSRNEFVIPADAVAHLGNGSSEAGAEVLENMVARVRKARTGSVEQAPQIVAGKFLPI